MTWKNILKVSPYEIATAREFALEDVQRDSARRRIARQRVHSGRGNPDNSMKERVLEEMKNVTDADIDKHLKTVKSRLQRKKEEKEEEKRMLGTSKARQLQRKRELKREGSGER